MRKTYLLLWILLFSGHAIAQDRLKIAFYNLFEYPNYTPNNRAPILKKIISEINPDMFLVCELLTEEAADNILYNVLDYDSKRKFARAKFIQNSTQASNLQQLLYYDANIWHLIDTESISTSYRDINKYKLQLITYDNLQPIYVYAFVTHLKSSTGLANRKIRLEMIESLITHLNKLEANSFVIFAGDFNVYTSKEEAYQRLLDKQNHIVFLDPLDTPGDWNKEESFAHLHTQSTRLNFSEFGGGAGGGMDDRFDFIMLSNNFFNHTSDLQFLDNSYIVYGNNGNCFKKSINDPDCYGKYSQNTRNSLYQMSDHLPVILELETERKILSNPKYKFKASQPILLINPVKDYLDILFPDTSKFNSYQGSFIINIYDSLGRLVLVKEIKSINTHLKISVEHLSSGLYYVQISNFLAQSFKFIKE